MYEILIPFYYSTDGTTAVLYSVGEVQPVNDDLSVGLLKEKFIKKPKGS